MAKKYIVSTIHGQKTRLQSIKQLEDEFDKNGMWFEGTAVLALNAEAAAVSVAEEDAIDQYQDQSDFRYVVIEVGELKVFQAIEAKVIVKEIV